MTDHKVDYIVRSIFLISSLFFSFLKWHKATQRHLRVEQVLEPRQHCMRDPVAPPIGGRARIKVMLTLLGMIGRKE